MGTGEYTPKRSTDEVYLVQNPALGAVLLWKFVEGYKRGCGGRCPSLPLLFIVLPILLSEHLRLQISSTQESSGIRLFAAKFSKTQEELFAIQHRMLKLRDSSLSSLSIAVECGLLTLDHSCALVDSSIKNLPRGVVDEIKVLAKLSAKLGVWCSALNIQEVQAALRIEF
ncbi:three component ABC system middle component [Pseudomonas sp. RT6P73]